MGLRDTGSKEKNNVITQKLIWQWLNIYSEATWFHIKARKQNHPPARQPGFGLNENIKKEKREIIFRENSSSNRNRKWIGFGFYYSFCWSRNAIMCGALTRVPLAPSSTLPRSNRFPGSQGSNLSSLLHSFSLIPYFNFKSLLYMQSFRLWRFPHGFGMRPLDLFSEYSVISTSMQKLWGCFC